ncbi:TonB-dependent receptor domain-containing protein [Ekhidna sp.]|uniref:TonB-dependent receptor domain-containing protein n=1 Tax=Ekhidna sp. TaxID=2608089 RepID=UPI003CCBC486
MIISVYSFAQTKTIEGRVTEKGTSKGIPHANVSVENTQIGTRTDGQGYFKIEYAPATSEEITISCIGFNSLTIAIDKVGTGDNIELEENILVLPQLVIESQSLTLGRVGLKEIPGSVQYISAVELKNYNYTNVNDIMKMVPGVNVQEEDGFGLRPNIGLRGSSLERSARITIMEDGILAAPAPYSSPSAYYFPTMGRMNSVEVLKGASQIRFGPFTTGGAINLMSTPIPNRFASKFQLTSGSYGYKNLHAYVGTKSEQVDFLVETFQYGADGFKELENGDDTGFDKKDYQIKVGVNTKTDAKVYQSLNVTVGQTFEDANETYLGLTASDFDDNPYQRYAASQLDNMDAEQSRFSLQHYIEMPGGVNIVTTAYRNDFARNWYKLQGIVDGPSLSSVLDNPETFPAAYQLLRGQSTADTASLNLRANNREYYAQGVQTVVDYEFETGNVSHDIHVSGRWHEDEEDRYQWEDLYAINDGTMKLIQPGTHGTQANRVEFAKAFASYILYQLDVNRWSFTPGIRYENITVSRKDYGKNDVERTGSDLLTRSNSFSVWLPGVGVNYQLSDQLNLFSGVHRGFAPAGSSDDTDPELSTNYELGIRKTNSKVEGSAVLFYTDYQSLLGRDIAAAGGIGSGDAFNAGTAITRGLEFQVGFDAVNTSSTISLPVVAAYTYTDAYFSKSFESELEPWGMVNKGDQLPYIANHQVYVNVGIQHKRASLFFNTKYQGDIGTVPGAEDTVPGERIDGFMVFDLSANVIINKFLSANISVSNVFDNKYAVAARPAGLRPGAPRMINFGVRADF